MASLSLRESERGWAGVWLLGYRRVVLLMLLVCVLGFAFGFVMQSSARLVDSFREVDGSSMFAGLER
jgi:hypothetical protein